MTSRSPRLLALVALVAGCNGEKPSPGGAATGSREPAAAKTATATTATATAASSGAPAPPSAAAASAAVAAGPPRIFSFDKDKAGEAPSGFEIVNAGGKAGKWLVKAEGGAPSAPNVLAQLDTEKVETRVTAALVSGLTAKDVRVAVRCKVVSGKVDRSCAIVARYKDEKNYYLARLDGVEGAVDLYVVKDGKRASLGGWKGAAVGDAWHEIRLDAKADHLDVYWDGTGVFATNDRTFADAGRVGVWTRADAVTYYDDLTVTELK